MLEIDGSIGEGGGGVLRTALALSCVTGTGVEIFNIRAGRSQPGLRPQHVAALDATATITGAQVEGNKISSQQIRFRPGKVKPGSYRFSIGTAGSTLLLLHTVYLPLCLAGDSSRLKLEGGTHVPWSPPFEHTDRLWRPFLLRMGLEVTPNLQKAGYYPRGGGRIDVKIKNKTEIRPVKLTDRGGFKTLKVRGAVSNLNDKIAERMIRGVKRGARTLGITGNQVKEEIHRPPSSNPGAYVFVQADYENARGGFVGLGAKGKRAEIVAAEGWEEAAPYLRATEPVEPHLADQVLLPLALAKGESEFATTEITSHLITNASIIEMFSPASLKIEGEPGGPGKVRIKPLKRN